MAKFLLAGRILLACLICPYLIAEVSGLALSHMHGVVDLRQILLIEIGLPEFSSDGAAEEAKNWSERQKLDYAIASLQRLIAFAAYIFVLVIWLPFTLVLWLKRKTKYWIQAVVGVPIVSGLMIMVLDSSSEILQDHFLLWLLGLGIAVVSVSLFHGAAFADQPRPQPLPETPSPPAPAPGAETPERGDPQD